MPFSDIQKDFLTNSIHDINLATGSIRSGKTYVQLLRWHDYLWNECEDNTHCLITAKKADAAERNIIAPFMDMMQIEGCGDAYEYRRMPRRLLFKKKNITCWVEGANDEGAEARIRGMTIQGHLGDEVTLYPRSFFLQAIGRNSAGQRKKFYTCNPDSPSHYIYSEILQNRKIDKKVWHFNLLDNPILSEAYKKQIESLYTGVFYDRFIRGLWIMAEGVIYREFERKKHLFTEDTKYSEYVLGIDWGYENPLAIILFGVDFDGKYYALDEIYITHQLIDNSLKQLMQKKGWFDLKYDGRAKGIDYAYTDNNRPEQMAEFRNLTGITTVPADKRVLEGIQAVQTAFSSTKLKIHATKCPNLIRELESYAWKTDKHDIGKDEPVKINDHAVDALRYCIFSRTRSRVRVITGNPFKRG